MDGPRRIFLYDADCRLCAAAARILAEGSGGGLTSRPLQDPAMVALLDRIAPQRPWEALLLEVGGTRVRLHRGLGIRWRLLRGLGLGRSLRLVWTLWRRVPWGEAEVSPWARLGILMGVGQVPVRCPVEVPWSEGGEP